MNTQLIKNKIKNDKILNNIASYFNNEIYLVGGAIRDILLDKEIFDRDLIICDEDAGEFSKKIANFFAGKFIPLDEVNKIYRVILPDKINYLDITNPVNNSIEEDIKRRDLTINSIIANIKTGEVTDLCNGIDDFNNKILKGIQEINFTNDPLRLLRIFRFHAILGFEISQELMIIAKKYSNLIQNPAKERILYELMKLFSGEFTHSAISKMDEAGILNFLFPFVDELKLVPPNPHHHLDLFHHSIETIKQVQILYENSPQQVRSHLDKIDFGGFSRLAHLKLCAFMHDIGKYSTWFIEKETGRHRFYKHDEIGAQMSVPILKNLTFSNKQINYIKTIIKYHMYATMIVCSPQLNEKIMTRFVRKAADDALDMVIIAKADRLSALGPEITPNIVKENLTLLTMLQDFYLKSLDTLKPLPKLLDGNDVMKILNIKPSLELGNILKKLHQAQINGDVNSKEDAINFVKNIKI